jgi:hypothetical protein
MRLLAAPKPGDDTDQVLAELGVAVKSTETV